MVSTVDALHEAVGELNALVAKDGGSVTLAEHDPDRDWVKVRFAMSTKAEDCDTCAITPEMMQMFLAEAFRVRGAAVAAIEVEDVTGQTGATGTGANGVPA